MASHLPCTYPLPLCPNFKPTHRSHNEGFQLALTTAALAVPVVLLRRQRNNALAKALKNGPPPPRRSASIPGVPPLRQTTLSGPSSVPTPTKHLDLPSQPSDDFNGALYSAKAFGIATLSVTVGATAIIWGANTVMGVKDVRARIPPQNYVLDLQYVACRLKSLPIE